MACPTCDHTMEGIKPGLFWCPRCGTIRWPADPKASDAGSAVPVLVERCRAMEARALDFESFRLLDLLQKEGVSECINRPKDQKAAPLLTRQRIEHMLADAARLKSLAAEYGGVLSCGYVLDCADHIEALVAEIRRMAPERKNP